MNLIDFPERNTVYAESQPEYLPLPAHRYANDQSGRLTCCWSLSWRERFRVLLFGRIWHQILTFNHPLQPQLLTVDKPEMTAPGEGSAP